MPKNLAQDIISTQKEECEGNRQVKNEVVRKFKDKNDSVQFSSRYLQYFFAKRHLRRQSGRKILSVGGQNNTALKELTTGQSQGMRAYDPNGLSTTIAGRAGGWGAKTGLYMVSRPHGFNRGGKREYPNIRVSAMQNEFLKTGVKEGRKIRRLTPRECERLQSFPDDWTKWGLVNGKRVLISDSQRYKMCGNAVTTNVVKEIVWRLAKHH